MLTLTTVGEPGAPIELWELHDGTRVVVTYSAFPVLAASAGPAQPFRWLTAADLKRICDATDAQAVLDQPLPCPPRHPEPDVADQPDLPLLDDAEPEGDLVYVPSRPARPGDQTINLELQRHRNKTTLLAYTSAEAIKTGCGPHQPWVAIPVRELGTVLTESGAEQVLLNPVLSEETRHAVPVVDWTRKSRRETEWNA
ncbi:SAV_915 family protein [Prauserella cavernicola]|uniref:SseB family protein n=1 Tax=Prauserella cavernicola TaxID=2800127 RepID=A0A934QS35_9PSEU|nr:SAV_915 family protein [Prauserella cavernicola]MBK1785525.1 SseB family protein [Prauserella cavernicola]